MRTGAFELGRCLSDRKDGSGGVDDFHALVRDEIVWWNETARGYHRPASTGVAVMVADALVSGVPDDLLSGVLRACGAAEPVEALLKRLRAFGFTGSVST